MTEMTDNYTINDDWSFLYTNSFYIDDILRVSSMETYESDWDRMKNSAILISGGTGLLGSFLVDVIMRRNIECGQNCRIYLLTRKTENAKERFKYYYKYQNGAVANKYLIFIKCDVRLPFSIPELEKVDYVFHLASNTHPYLYSIDPIGTITTNITGLKNMLDFAKSHYVKRFVFASSNEIYGENRGDTEFFNEEYLGYINCNTLRAGYPEAKRLCEALCQAYITQEGCDIVIPRFTRSYGPTMLMSDTKALSQFIKKGLNKENIVLKSAGTQYYSFTYVSDAISGLMNILFKGQNGDAYNISDVSSDIMLKDLASLVAEKTGVDVFFEFPDTLEARGYSTATKARLDGSKLKRLGWTPNYDIERGIDRTIKIMRGRKNI